MEKQVFFYCYDCEHSNKMNIGCKGYEPLNVKTKSLTDAVTNHVILGHKVVTVFEEYEDEE